MRESAAYDIFVEEGEIKRGRKDLLLTGQVRFGSPDPATVIAVESIKDLDRLERLLLAVFKSNSWQELLTTP